MEVSKIRFEELIAGVKNMMVAAATYIYFLRIKNVSKSSVLKLESIIHGHFIACSDSKSLALGSECPLVALKKRLLIISVY